MFALAALLTTVVLAAGGGAMSEKGIDNLFSFQALTAFVILAALEIVLGIDNIVFIAILAEKLPPEQQEKARKLGLSLAMGIRILLLLAIGWIMGLTKPLFSFPAFWTGAEGDRHGVSGRDLILLMGGLFLIYKSTHEIHDKLEGEEHDEANKADKGKPVSFQSVIVQILLLDIVFSLDSVITAVGMVKADPNKKWVALTIMIAAVVLAVGVMLVFAGRLSNFIKKHPTLKILALSFLLMIGVMLVAEGFHFHIPKGYIYFSMAFAVAMELINMRVRKVASPPVSLHNFPVAHPQGTAAAPPPPKA